jgi:hypothetical protein
MSKSVQQRQRKNNIVTIGLIMVVAFLGFQLYLDSQNPRSPSRQSEDCISNVRRLATACLTYAADNDNVLPSASIWMDLAKISLSPTHPKEGSLDVFRCPSVAKSPSPLEYGYAYSDQAKGSLNAIRNPQTTPFIFDSSDLGWNAHGTIDLLPVPPRHRANTVAFGDGHTKAFKVGEPVR